MSTKATRYRAGTARKKTAALAAAEDGREGVWDLALLIRRDAAADDGLAVASHRDEIHHQFVHIT